MRGIVLPDSPGRLMVGVELLEPIVVNPNAVLTPVEIAPAPEPERVEAGAECHKVIRRPAISGPVSEIERRVIGIGPIAVDAPRIIVRNIDDVGPGRLDHDLLILGRDRLLRCRSERTGGLRTLAQALNGVHDIRLLREKGVAELLGPLQIAVHHAQELRKRNERFDARIPGLLLQRRRQYVALKRRVGGSLQPAVRLDNLERVGRGHQDLCNQRIGVERNRCHQPIDLRGGERHRAGCRSRLRRRARRIEAHEGRDAHHGGPPGLISDAGHARNLPGNEMRGIDPNQDGARLPCS